jgi:hypothetical protein
MSPTDAECSVGATTRSHTPTAADDVVVPHTIDGIPARAVERNTR